MDYEQVLSELFSRKRFRMKLGLERVKKVLSSLGEPQNSYKTIHIAGTNGKGSTGSMITAILREAGYKVGLYTSPFLRDFRESITIDGEIISKEEVTRIYDKLKDSDLTYFELKTIMAFLHFRDKADIAVIEVGLGGRLDATNVITPEISVITNTKKDHTHILGDDIETIAKEKAGIIKPKIPIITRENGEGFKVIKRIAKEREAPFRTSEERDMETNLPGRFQRRNASLAHDVMREFGIDTETIKKGLMNSSIHGRFESKDNMILDCAHNLPAFRTLNKELRREDKRTIMVISILVDKDRKGMIEEIENTVDHFIFTTVDIPRASKAEELSRFTRKSKEVIDDPGKAIERAKALAGHEDRIIIAGSCYLTGKVMDYLRVK
ncbi:MAG: bifunctional folylpolyglutamate synthase/dihydrofolate synthase [Nanobdellota archaeon]